VAAAPAGTLSSNALAGFFTFSPARPDVDASVVFAYGVRDTAPVRTGDTSWLVTNNVTINRVLSPGQVLDLGAVSGGPLTLKFAGIPGYEYAVQRKTNLTDVVWETVWTTNAPAGRGVDYVDDAPPPPRRSTACVLHSLSGDHKTISH